MRFIIRAIRGCFLPLGASRLVAAASSRNFPSLLQTNKNIGTQCVLELFCEMLIMLIRQGEVRKWLNGESFICGIFRFCYGAGGV